MPIEPVEFAWLKVERNCGSWLSASPSDTSPRVPSSCVAVIVCTGTAASIVLRMRMREPVTTISSSCAFSVWFVAGACCESWAKAGVANSDPASAVALSK